MKAQLNNLIHYILNSYDNVANISSYINEENLYVLLRICCFDHKNQPKYIKYAIPYDTPQDFEITKHKSLLAHKLLAIR